MKYLEIEGINSEKVISVTGLDKDQDIEIEVRNLHEGLEIGLWLSVPKVKQLIEFLQDQIKEL